MFAEPSARTQDLLARMRDFFEARVRQLAAVLDAHGVAVTYVDCPDPDTARDALAA